MSDDEASLLVGVAELHLGVATTGFWASCWKVSKAQKQNKMPSWALQEHSQEKQNKMPGKALQERSPVKQNKMPVKALQEQSQEPKLVVKNRVCADSQRRRSSSSSGSGFRSTYGVFWVLLFLGFLVRDASACSGQENQSNESVIRETPLPFGLPSLPSLPRH